MKLLVLLMLYVATSRSEASEVCAGPTQLTPEQIQEALDAHNLFRSQAGNGDAANVVKMKWSDDLASRAQDWANKCEFVHQMTTLCDGETHVGQNLYMGSVSLGINVTRFIEGWNDEKQNYTYSDHSCKGVCGHYTQVVWADSTEVGCAMHTCDTLSYVCSLKNKNNAVFACNYYPPGNYLGDKPYIEGTPCSDCASTITSGGHKCEDNLCVPCAPADDPDCECVESLDCLNGGSWDEGSCECMCDVQRFYGPSCEKSCQCEDVSPYCDQWTHYCENPSFKTFMTSNCQGTCTNLCDAPDSCV